MSNADRGRIIHISKQRERTKDNIEKNLMKLEQERKNLQADIQSKFTTNVDVAEEQLKADTVGLVSLDKMKEKQLEILKKGDDIIIGKESSPNTEKAASSKSNERTVEKRFLSFGNFDDEEDEEEFVQPLEKKRLGMNPDVETNFLPDREREQALVKKKEELAQEWRILQEKEKNEEITVAFSYWDGSAHRKDTKMKKGATIGEFLQRAIDMLKKQFSELRTASTESLMFVKEDLIIPHFHAFLDFISAKPMGKTGPLWKFDAVGEIRLRQDAALDCGESHPVKVVLRSWYEKNKHIYPASQWEPFALGKVYKIADDLTKI